MSIARQILSDLPDETKLAENLKGFKNLIETIVECEHIGGEDQFSKAKATGRMNTIIAKRIQSFATKTKNFLKGILF